MLDWHGIPGSSLVKISSFLNWATLAFLTTILEMQESSRQILHIFARLGHRKWCLEMDVGHPHRRCWGSCPARYKTLLLPGAYEGLPLCLLYGIQLCLVLRPDKHEYYHVVGASSLISMSIGKSLKVVLIGKVGK